ncbi:MAG: hypothetical protein BJ554DRAFT_3149, partial [Olpidium bornovanus]
KKKKKKVPSGREYGVVFVPAEETPVANTLESAQMILVREGLARTPTPVLAGNVDLSDDIDSLAVLETNAKDAGKGIWADPADVVRVSVSFRRGLRTGAIFALTLTAAFAPAAEHPRELVEKYGRSNLPGIFRAVVEQVREGSSFRLVLFLEGGQLRQHVNLLLSGVKCPAIRIGVPNQPDLVEPFAEEAKYFVESRLLQMDVEVVLEGTSGASSLVGSVIHPKGNIAEHLLAAGLARVQEWSCPLVTGGAAALRAAEKRARDQYLRLWKDYDPKANADTGFKAKSFEATVSRIISGDTITLRDDKSGETRKVQLSSVRQPK